MNEVTMRHAIIWRKSILGRRDKNVPNPEMGLWLTCSNNSMEASVSGVEWVMTGVEVRELDGEISGVTELQKHSL